MQRLYTNIMRLDIGIGKILDQLEEDGFKEYKNPDDPTQTIQLKEVSPAASSAILGWLTLKEVATYLGAKASSELRPTLS